MGDLNLNWEDKTKRKKLKVIRDKYHLEQLIKGPTRVTKVHNLNYFSPINVNG